MGDGWVRRDGIGGEGGWVARGETYPLLGHGLTDSSAVSSVSDKNRLNHVIGWDSSWQKPGTTHILINALYWLHRPYSAPS